MIRNQKKKSKENRYTHLTETPVPKLVTQLAIPTIIAMMVTSIYNAADTYFVGRITEGATGAVAAVGVSFSVMSLMQALAFLCGHGSGNYLSRMLGAGKQKEADEMAATGFTLALIIGISFTVLSHIFLTPFSYLLGAREEFIAETRQYLRILVSGAPFLMGQIVINNQLRFQGAAFYSMIGLVSGALLNIVLDPVMIFGLGMGVSGAAAATVISQVVGFTVLWMMSRRGENLRIRAANIRLNRHYLWEIINGGSPSLARQGLAAVSTMALNTMAGAYGGTAAVAGMSVCTRVTWLATSVVVGIGQGFQPVCSFNFGAKLYSRVKEGFFFCLRNTTIFLFAFSVFAYMCAPQIIHFFRSDPDVVTVGADALRYQMLPFTLNGMMVMTSMMTQSMGKGGRASFLAAARSGLFFLPTIVVLPRFFGLTGVEITQAVADVFAFLIALPVALVTLKRDLAEE